MFEEFFKDENVKRLFEKKTKEFLFNQGNTDIKEIFHKQKEFPSSSNKPSKNITLPILTGIEFGY